MQCFGDIAQAIGGAFETYLSVVAQVLQQAAAINVPDTSFEMLDYVVSLREGIMDAWGGAIMAMRAGGKSEPVDTFTLLPMLTRTCSTTTPAIRRVDLPASADNLPGPQPH